MLKKLLKPLITIFLLSLMVNLFHHDIANIWHKAVHMANAEDHHHSHESFHSHANNDFKSSHETHHHHLISKFTHSFDHKNGFAQEGELPKLIVNNIKHLNTSYKRDKNYSNSKPIIYFDRAFILELIYIPTTNPPPNV